MAKKKTKNQMPEYSLSRYALTGAGLGGYFGFVFNPISQNPSFLLPFWLGAVIAIVMFIYRLFRILGDKGGITYIYHLLRLAKSKGGINSFYHSLHVLRNKNGIAKNEFLRNLRKIPIDYAKYVIFLLVLQSRHLLFNWGGKTAVIIGMIIAGGLLGVWYSKNDDPLGMNT